MLITPPSMTSAMRLSSIIPGVEKVGRLRAWVSASFSSKYQYSAEGSSLMRTKLVPIPPPALLEERIRALIAAKGAAAIMGMSNIFYRFRHLSTNEKYATMPARHHACAPAHADHRAPWRRSGGFRTLVPGGQRN